MQFSPSFQQLIDALRCLPTVGQKTAQRMALHLLERDRAGAGHLAEAIGEALEKLGHCRSCRVFTEGEICPICADDQRDDRLLCVVESPADWIAIESSGAYQGRYFLLLGRLSPLDGIGPDELKLDQLAARLDQSGIEEVILATSATIEGEATAGYVTELARSRGLRVTRLAQGVPMGGELEYIDASTLSLALKGRREADS
ncbi:recombination protein RecR [Guyparkeria sp. SCN-R1]|uniref:recombination mediator RecR n=1 Tax=Guyparkeria sp. SCN-R1 TaxID=2341113 RepID=UPI000F650F1E|nr:recombination mediator RecR [Guyparkeria sp. SCN-R1]RRQ23693.1 recombination protein RecR [Guyparkeria sp. SCN-R1]